MKWLAPQFDSEHLNEQNVVMVDIGEGNSPGSDWWIVTIKQNNNEVGTYFYSWLTNRPSTPDQDPATWQWIMPSSLDQTPSWDGIPWSGDRLRRGQAAETLSLSCLG